jgi:hypothetical protein
MAASVPDFVVNAKAERTPLALGRAPDTRWFRIKARLLVHLLQSGPKAKSLGSKTTGDHLQVW